MTLTETKGGFPENTASSRPTKNKNSPGMNTEYWLSKNGFSKKCFQKDKIMKTVFIDQVSQEVVGETGHALNPEPGTLVWCNTDLYRVVFYSINLSEYTISVFIKKM